MMDKKGKPCPVCGRDMGPYTDTCDPCYQLKSGLAMLDTAPIDKKESLRRLGLMEIP